MDKQGLDGKILVVLGAEGSCPQHVQGVDEDQGAREVLPALGDGVLHLVQPRVQLLDDVPVAVPHLAAPGEQEVVRWLPHGLGTGGDREGIRAQSASHSKHTARKTAPQQPQIPVILQEHGSGGISRETWN